MSSPMSCSRDVPAIYSVPLGLRYIRFSLMYARSRPLAWLNSLTFCFGVVLLVILFLALGSCVCFKGSASPFLMLSSCCTSSRTA
jgi:hypothetical protein